MGPAWCQGGGESPAWGWVWDSSPGCCWLSSDPLIPLLWMYKSGLISCCHSQNGKIQVPNAVPSTQLLGVCAWRILIL